MANGKPGKPKGYPRTGGRLKGTPNKSTASVKAALEAAFEGMGGVPKLLEWAAKEPAEFYKLWAKMLPTDINAVVSSTKYVVRMPARPVDMDEWKKNYAPPALTIQ